MPWQQTMIHIRQKQHQLFRGFLPLFLAAALPLARFGLGFAPPSAASPPLRAPLPFGRFLSLPLVVGAGGAEELLPFKLLSC